MLTRPESERPEPASPTTRSEPMELIVNGVHHNVDADANMPLLWAVRDLLGLHGTKFGCGVGAFGAFTVHLDGVAGRSCLLLPSDVERHALTTLASAGDS